MRMIKEIVAYIKDNPEGYWFKRKLYGWGWTPATKEGWLVTVGFLAFIIWYAFRLETMAQVGLLEVAPLIAAVVVLITVCYKTGESPRWQWGLKDD